MEITARYRLIGLFMLAIIGVGFVFVYWLQNAGGLAERVSYTLHFTDNVGGLQPGAPVLFDGLRVGEVTSVVVDSDDPHLIVVTVGVNKETPLRADSTVRIDYQGLTGAATIALNGGSPNLPKLNTMAKPPVLVAGSSASQGLSDMAREVLGRLDKLFGDNSADLHETIVNLKNFSGALSKNSGKIDTILAGLEKMFAAPPKPVMAIYDLNAPTNFPALKQPPQAQLVVNDLTPLLIWDTQQILLKPAQGTLQAIENAQWADSVPKLVQEKVIQSFENAHYVGAVSRPIDRLAADYQLIIDLRAFDVSLSPTAHAEIELTAKIMSSDGKIVGARDFRAEAPAQTTDAAGATAALNTAFGKVATDLVNWTAPLVFLNKPTTKAKPVEGEVGP